MSLKLMNILPDEIIDIIFSLMTPMSKIFLNKTYYIKYNCFIDLIIRRERYYSYVRDIIRNDDHFVFRMVVQRKFYYWLSITNYLYKNITYYNYILFLIYYSNKYNAHKCNNIINIQLNLSGLKKKWCKNNKIKYNKWSF